MLGVSNFKLEDWGISEVASIKHGLNSGLDKILEFGRGSAPPQTGCFVPRIAGNFPTFGGIIIPPNPGKFPGFRSFIEAGLCMGSRLSTN